eukprot:CAMPEP_0170614474 /NCGR_PEP_ID=MMETSP0224-20130122/24825_1 /TAXON_ID=285029 /ORGANISM="Togula jolla, Strain CCCM 725" /LENGTH=141 /DNA_ID=CAMNT_0010940145 /DNA_START=276 /DNA_END=701 /DNA_ORIENTATION=-
MAHSSVPLLPRCAVGGVEACLAVVLAADGAEGQAALIVVYEAPVARHGARRVEGIVLQRLVAFSLHNVRIRIVGLLIISLRIIGICLIVALHVEESWASCPEGRAAAKGCENPDEGDNHGTPRQGHSADDAPGQWSPAPLN